MKKTKSRFIAEGAMIAALYVILTYVSMALGLDKMAVQLRFSEALTILPVFTPAAVPGLFLGCLIANILTGCILVDVILGSLATLVAAIVTRKLQRLPYLAPIPAIAANTIVVPPILAFIYHVETALPLIYLTVFLGEVVSAGVLGTILTRILKKRIKHS
ncbi:MAG: QueT transporter family protein [Clostridia bacterium]|nr:QueT transporter family protein [Clostridia bacterium]